MAAGDGHILQLALAPLVADRAVVGMVHHQPLDDMGALLLRLRVEGGDDHAVLGLDHARHLHPLDRPLGKGHGAEAAGADRPEGLVVAEVRDDDPQHLRRLKHIGAGRDGDGAVIDGQRRHKTFLPQRHRDTENTCLERNAFNSILEGWNIEVDQKTQ